MAKKAIEWTKIKADYLNGVTPKDLANKYGVEPKKIHEKSSKENWTAEKASIYKNLQEQTQEQIKRITSIALRRLEEVLTGEEVRTKDLVSAIGKALDISGLKAETLNIADSNLTISVVKKD